MPLSDSDEAVGCLAARTAARHRPKGFTAETAAEADGTLHITVRYCWRDSPRFDVESEVLLVGEETAEAVRSVFGLRTGALEWVAGHICRFQAQRA